MKAALPLASSPALLLAPLLALAACAPAAEAPRPAPAAPPAARAPAWPAPGVATPDPWLPPPPSDRPKTAGTAIGALVCGITSILCTGFVGIVLGPTALGLGLAARRRIRTSNGWRTGEGLATAGIVCGIIGILLSIVYLVFLIRNPNFIGDFLNDLTSTTTADRRLQNA